MNISKDRLIAVGKENIAKRAGGKDEEKSFIRRVLKRFGEGKAFLIGETPTKCICGKSLNRGSAAQVMKYCSRECRKRRHNAKR